MSCFVPLLSTPCASASATSSDFLRRCASRGSGLRGRRTSPRSRPLVLVKRVIRKTETSNFRALDTARAGGGHEIGTEH